MGNSLFGGLSIQGILVIFLSLAIYVIGFLILVLFVIFLIKGIRAFDIYIAANKEK